MHPRMTTSRILSSVTVVLIAGLALVAVGTARLARWEVLEVRDPARVRMSCGAWRPGGLQAGQEVGPTLIDTGRDSELVLGLGDLLVLRMSPDASIDLPSSPARWFGRHSTLRVLRGEIVLSSGDRALGRRLAIWTEAGMVLLDGADLVVRREEARVDVVLLRGAAELVTPDGVVHVLTGEIEIRLAEEAPSVTIPVDDRTRGLAGTLPRVGVIPGD
ncbi:FecR domain-containing protein [bacterium]|nr:FecR domain-containing protein [bacterium]